MVHPNIMPLDNLSASTSTSGATADLPAPRQPRVEYLATLSRHSAAVNVVRFSPNGMQLF
jgi:chromatin assembly factor 1 subunit B